MGGCGAGAHRGRGGAGWRRVRLGTEERERGEGRAGARGARRAGERRIREMRLDAGGWDPVSSGDGSGKLRGGGGSGTGSLGDRVRGRVYAGGGGRGGGGDGLGECKFRGRRKGRARGRSAGRPLRDEAAIGVAVGEGHRRRSGWLGGERLTRDDGNGKTGRRHQEAR